MKDGRFEQIDTRLVECNRLATKAIESSLQIVTAFLPRLPMLSNSTETNLMKIKTLQDANLALNERIFDLEIACQEFAKTAQELTQSVLILKEVLYNRVVL